MSTPERAKLRLIVAGDAEATAWLYERFAARLHRRLRWRYGDLDAEELLQDTYLLVLRDGAALLARGMERMPPGGTTAARIERFLWDQACGLATNRRRSARHQRVVPLLGGERLHAGDDPESRTVSRDSMARMASCLEAAGDRIYLYFKLRYVDGLTPAEITRTTGWSRRATYKLKQSLDEATRRCAEELGIDEG